MTAFNLPDLGEGLTEAEIVAWHVAEGDRVVADQPLLSVETEKAVVEIPAPRAGTIGRLLVAVGDIVPVGAPLLDYADGPGERSGALVGRLAEAEPTPSAPAPAAEEPAAAPYPAASQPNPLTGTAAAPKVMPAVRQLARQRGVDLAHIPPSGAHGEITREDVLAAVAGADVVAVDAADWQALRGPRRTMAQTMARAGASVVPATVMDEAVLPDLPAGFPVLPLLVRALAAGCAVEPALNAWFDPEGPRRLLHGGVNLGIAVDTPDGLLVPVLRGAEVLAPADLEAELQRIIGLARSREAGPEIYRDPTITLSNFGPLGGRHAVLVVVPPQVAILGAGRIHDDGVPGQRLLPLSLTFDHRAVTGGEAARFLQAVMAAVEVGPSGARHASHGEPS